MSVPFSFLNDSDIDIRNSRLTIDPNRILLSAGGGGTMVPIIGKGEASGLQIYKSRLWC
jgi:hypothetical protein